MNADSGARQREVPLMLPCVLGWNQLAIRWKAMFWLESQEVLNRVELVDLHPSYDQMRLKLEFSAEEPDAICLANLRITGIFCDTKDG